MSVVRTVLQVSTAVNLLCTAACAPVESDALETSLLDASVEDSDDSISKYSVLSTIQYSILREYDRAAKSQGARIRYPVCVTAEFAVTDAARQNYMRVEQQAINTWNDVLRGQPGWAVDQIELYMVGNASPSSCPTTHNGLKVYKLVGLANQNRGYAEFYNYKNAIGRSEWNRADLRRELHEYGHQLGLGDTYTEAGYQTPQGQPAGVMNLYFDVKTLTNDDIAGVRHVWNMIRTGSNNPCGSGYTAGTASTNRNGHRFCVPLNGKPPTKPPVDDGTPPGQCTDRNTHCAAWAKRGECSANPGYMLSNCCASCGSGGSTGVGNTTCRDSNASCSSWARAGECTRNPNYMRTSCCASCKGR